MLGRLPPPGCYTLANTHTVPSWVCAPASMQFPGRTARLFPTWMSSSGSLLGGEHRVYSRRETCEKAIFGSAPALQTDVRQFSAQTCTVNRRYQPLSIPGSEALGGRPVKQGKSSEGSAYPATYQHTQHPPPRYNPPPQHLLPSACRLPKHPLMT